MPFTHEAVFYNGLFPMLAAKNSAIKEIAPTCYHAYSDGEEGGLNPGCWERTCAVGGRKEKGVIVLEDLKQVADRAFHTIDKSEVPTIDHVMLVMRAAGRYHGAMWQLLHSTEEAFKDAPVSKEEVEQFYGGAVPKSAIKKSVKKLFKELAELMSNKDLDEEFIEKVRKYKAGRAADLMLDKSSPIATIVHGDLWTNNMMFSGDADGNPEEVRLLDFQAGRIAHPALDLAYFLYCNTDAVFRKAHLDRCLREYFGVFGLYLTGLEGFGFEEFKREWDKYLEAGMIMGMLVRNELTFLRLHYIPSKNNSSLDCENSAQSRLSGRRPSQWQVSEEEQGGRESG